MRIGRSPVCSDPNDDPYYEPRYYQRRYGYGPYGYDPIFPLLGGLLLADLLLF